MAVSYGLHQISIVSFGLKFEENLDKVVCHTSFTMCDCGNKYLKISEKISQSPENTSQRLILSDRYDF